MKNTKLVMVAFALVAALGFGNFAMEPSAAETKVTVSALTSTDSLKLSASAPEKEAAPVAAAEAPAEAQPAPALQVPAPILDPANPGKEIPSQDFIKYLLASIGGWKGLGAWGLAGLITQLLGAFLMSPLFATLVGLKQSLAEWAGKWKLRIVCGLSLVSGICLLVATGLDWSAALVHSSTLAAFQVFLHQVWKQEKEPAKVVA